MDEKAPEKKERLLAALEKGMVMLHLDARKPGVRVPSHLADEVHLRLNISYRFDPPDLTVGDWGVRCTLSFSGRRFPVAVPWSALFAFTSQVTQEFWLYPSELPAELLEQSLLAAQEPEPAPRGGLREVKCDPPEDGQPAPRTPPAGRAHLRLVK